MEVTQTIEIWLRGGLFLSLLLLFILAESLWPKRRRVLGRWLRWRTNIGFTILNTLALKVLGPITAISAAGYAAHNHIGLFNWIQLPPALSFVLAIILLDFAIYAQHVATHKIPLLWRLHKVHHSDRDIDTTTALRFHPIEILLSMIFKCGLVLLIGPVVFAVLIFEVLLNGSALFNHSNLGLPKWLDRPIRVFIVTPDMHRVHHSVHVNETNSNYGFFLSIWDRLFRTYNQAPKDGHKDMIIGLTEYQNEAPAKFIWSMRLPFSSKSPYIEER